MSNIRFIPPRRAGPELQAAYAAAREYLGIRPWLPATPQVMLGLSHRPAILHSTFEAYFYASRCGTLPCAARELVAVMVSRANDCFY